MNLKIFGLVSLLIANAFALAVSALDLFANSSALHAHSVRRRSSIFDNIANIFSEKNGCVKTVAAHFDWVTSIELLPSKRLASAALDRYIKVWSLHNYACLKVLRGHTGAVRSLALISATNRSVMEDIRIVISKHIITITSLIID